MTVVAATSASASPEVALPRPYIGAIISGTGTYAHATGTTTILLAITRRDFITAFPEPNLAVTMTLRGAGCKLHRRHPKRPCLNVSGTLTGSASYERPLNPDLPRKLLLANGAGTLGPLGPVTAVGTFRGTGYVPKGHTQIWIAVTNALGSVSIGGDGPLVGGFQEP
jgi:hypothetical protein